MRNFIAQTRSFDSITQLLLINQFGINFGFYLLMPYLATHLSLTLGLAGWIVGLILGARNFSQQGMYVFGGTLADRFGYRPMIIAGCGLRVIGFGALAVVTSAPALLMAAMTVGVAGALFNPAVRAYVVQQTGPRRIEAFALFNVFYHLGILLGPLAGLFLTGVDFRLTCLVTALIFTILTIAQVRLLPRQKVEKPKQEQENISSQWRGILQNRNFLLFSLAMVSSYVMSFQMYLALPLQIRSSSTDTESTVGIAVLFSVSGLLALTSQRKITSWYKRRFNSGTSISIGLSLMGVAFLPLFIMSLLPTEYTQSIGWTGVILPTIVSGLILTLGFMIIYPFEMDTIVILANNRLVATHYGLYSTIAGIGIALGNLVIGALLDLGARTHFKAIPWLVLSSLGGIAAMLIYQLGRTGKLQQTTQETALTVNEK